MKGLPSSCELVNRITAELVFENICRMGLYTVGLEIGGGSAFADMPVAYVNVGSAIQRVPYRAFFR